MTAAIMMVTYNRLDLTRQTLDSLFASTDYPFHLYVVDNASSDSTVEFLHQICAEKLSENGFLKAYTIKKNDVNQGIAYGRNQALQLTQNEEWLSTIDNDVCLPHGWLTEAIDIIRKNPKFGAIGVNMEGVSYPIITLNGKEFQKKLNGNLGTACTVFSRKLHKMIGFFNCEMKNYGHDDADFFFRARVVGYELGYIKENGQHLGEGENDKGEYREFKNTWHKNNLQQFYDNCRLYLNGKKSVYIGFKE